MLAKMKSLRASVSPRRIRMRVSSWSALVIRGRVEVSTPEIETLRVPVEVAGLVIKSIFGDWGGKYTFGGLVVC